MRAIAAVPAAPVPQENELLSMILSELLLLRADVAALRMPALASDDAAPAGLLRAIHGAVADRLFSAGDLLVHAALPISGELHAAIVAAIGIANARRIGKYFARIEGRDLGGYVVERVEMDSSGILWKVRVS